MRVLAILALDVLVELHADGVDAAQPGLGLQPAVEHAPAPRIPLRLPHVPTVLRNLRKL
jgi:hypothetical protein